MGILPVEYINITKLFLLVEKLIRPILDQHLSHHLFKSANIHDEVIYMLEKLFFTLILLDYSVNDAFDIVNNFLKKIQNQNRLKLPNLILLVNVNFFI